MPKVLFTWGLGGGFGHMMSIKPLAVELQKNGHDVLVALRDVSQAEKVFGDTEMRYVASPIRLGKVASPIDPACSFAHVLHNTCFSDENELRALCNAWQSIFGLFLPDLIVADHSPVSLLAARMMNIPAMIMGTGFSCPHFESPWPNWRPEIPVSVEQLRRDEHPLLERVNKLLAESGIGILGSLADLYGADRPKLLLTYRELDPFGDRIGADYIGGFPDESTGVPPRWPTGPTRIFAYLKAFPALPNLLASLKSLGLPTIIRSNSFPPNLTEEFSSPTLLFEENFIDFPMAARQCDIAIVSATHLVSESLLLAGKPLLMIPPFLEQRLTAEKVAEMGAGIVCSPRASRTEIEQKLRAILRDGKYRAQAQEFARRYQHVDRRQQLLKAVNKIEQLLKIPTA